MLWQVLKTQITKIDIPVFLHTRQHILRLIILIWKLKPRWYQYKQIDLVLTLLTHTCQKSLLSVHHLLLGVNQVVIKPVKSELRALSGACGGCCEDDDVFRALLFRSCPYVVTLLAPLESWIHFKWGSSPQMAAFCHKTLRSKDTKRRYLNCFWHKIKV